MRVGIYARVSTEAQEARGTIGSQLEALRAKVAAGSDELVAEFVDDGYSGARLDRPGLDSLRDAAQGGVIDAIWCLSPDRLARAYAYQVLILDELARHRVPVFFTDAPPLDDPQARLLVQVQGVIAEYEKAKFAERERRGKLFRARAGEVLSHKVPYGYRRVPRSPAGPAHVIVHEPEAAVVRRMFAEYLGGAGIRRIAINLRADGVASPDGKPIWPLATIGRLLRNEAYIGRLYWNRTSNSYDPALGRERQTRRPRDEWIEIPIPAIVDTDSFEAVEGAARDNSGFASRRTQPDTFLLRRLVRCGHCGVKVTCHTTIRGQRAGRGPQTARYYSCPHRDPLRAGGEDRRCPERRIRADELDTFVFDQVRQLLARPDLLAAGETAIAAQTPAPDNEIVAAQLAHIDRRIDGAEAERRRLADLYQTGVIDTTEMTKRAGELDARRHHLDQQRHALADRHTELSEHNRLTRHVEAFAERALATLDDTDFAQRQQLLRLVLEDVRVEGWQVELRLRLPLDDDPPDNSPIRAITTTKTRASRSRRHPRQPKEAVSSNDRLRSIGETPQKHTDRRARPDTMAEHLGGRPGPQQVAVVDRVATGEHRVDHRHRLVPHIGPARGGAQIDMGVEQFAQAEVFGQGGGQDQPGVSHQVLIIEDHPSPVQAVQECAHREGALRLCVNVASLTNILAGGGTFSADGPIRSDPTLRWIRA
ncbi:MAG: recombinase family protein [Actinomycetota bacterium]|nr:recombinase family protein [Actinomycetota bacterium]